MKIQDIREDLEFDVHSAVYGQIYTNGKFIVKSVFLDYRANYNSTRHICQDKLKLSVNLEK